MYTFHTGDDGFYTNAVQTRPQIYSLRKVVLVLETKDPRDYVGVNAQTVLEGVFPMTAS